MSKERELLNKAIEIIQIVPLMASIGHAAPDFGSELILEIQELLAQPEQAVAECTNSDTWNCKYCNKTESCGALKDSRNFAPPKREPLGLEIMDACGSEDYREGFKDGALYAEKCHGIGEE